MESIYKMTHGAYIDLDKIVNIDPVTYSQPHFWFAVHFQLLSDPVQYKFIKVINRNTGDVLHSLGIGVDYKPQGIFFNIYEEYNRLIEAWKSYKAFKNSK